MQRPKTTVCEVLLDVKCTGILRSYQNRMAFRYVLAHRSKSLDCFRCEFKSINILCTVSNTLNLGFLGASCDVQGSSPSQFAPSRKVEEDSEEEEEERPSLLSDAAFRGDTSG